MTRETLLALALQAIDDPDAREVLQDALLEHGPSVTVEEILSTVPPTVRVEIDSKTFSWPTPRLAVTPFDRLFARALAAVLLFGDWSTETWPLFRRCRTVRIFAATDVQISINGHPLVFESLEWHAEDP